MTLQNFSSHVSGVLLCFFLHVLGSEKPRFFWGRFYHTNTLQNTSEDHTKCAPKSPIRSSGPPNQLHLFPGCFGTPQWNPTPFHIFSAIYKRPKLGYIPPPPPPPTTPQPTVPFSPPNWHLSLCHANCQPSREFQVQVLPPKAGREAKGRV